MADNVIVPPVDDSPEAMAIFLEQVCVAINDGVTAIADIGDPGEGGGIVVGDLTTPTNLTATGGYAIIVLSWDAATYAGHSHTVIMRSQNSSSITNAEIVGSSSTNIFTDVIPNPDITDVYYYWIYFVDLNGDTGS